FNGENWNPDLRAPLTQPGVSAKAGEYIVKLDGQELRSTDDIFERLEDKAGKQIHLLLSATPDGKNARDVVVIPLADETALRRRTWEEDNRRAVARLSAGKLGYAHIPDTNIGGWTNFSRYYYSQIDKAGMVVDERFNGGGEVDDYMVNTMTEPLASMWMSRYGKDFSSPAWANFGPKVLLINEMAGSGGDYFPWHFRHAHAGPIVGRRTWGGLVGILTFPVLVDGGYVTAPNVAFYNPDGTWDVENHGVDPDMEVDLDPHLWREGRDTQLEKGVEVAMKLLESHKPPAVKRPAYKDKSTVKGAEARP
ncbi:MAG TPA: S41 family peptidase, partial [Fimbriimonadaceae bacterium]|nr:S41 family peptidase [Fimbriimonadaceae bacterium]